MKMQRSNSAEKLTLELKYCERCGALWLRPARGRHVYCVDCALEIADLPPASSEPKTPGLGTQQNVVGGEFGEYAEDDGRGGDAGSVA